MLVKKRPKVVHIRFWDHAQCEGEEASPCECVVVGLLHKEDALCYYIVCWIADQTLDSNTEQFAILKSTVIETTYLKATRRIRGKASNGKR